MKRGGMLIFIFLVVFLSVSIVSASWLSDVWNKFLGKQAELSPGDVSCTPACPIGQRCIGRENMWGNAVYTCEDVPLYTSCGTFGDGGTCADFACSSLGMDEAQGTCTAGKTCCKRKDNPCTPESDSAFCARLGKSCGAVSANDNCGNSRSVGSCGSCSGSQTCIAGECTDITPVQRKDCANGGTCRTRCDEILENEVIGNEDCIHNPDSPGYKTCCVPKQPCPIKSTYPAGIGSIAPSAECKENCGSAEKKDESYLCSSNIIGEIFSQKFCCFKPNCERVSGGLCKSVSECGDGLEELEGDSSYECFHNQKCCKKIPEKKEKCDRVHVFDDELDFAERYEKDRLEKELKTAIFKAFNELYFTIKKTQAQQGIIYEGVKYNFMSLFGTDMNTVESIRPWSAAKYTEHIRKTSSLFGFPFFHINEDYQKWTKFVEEAKIEYSKALINRWRVGRGLEPARYYLNCRTDLDCNRRDAGTENLACLKSSYLSLELYENLYDNEDDMGKCYYDNKISYKCGSSPPYQTLYWDELRDPKTLAVLNDFFGVKDGRRIHVSIPGKISYISRQVVYADKKNYESGLNSNGNINGIKPFKDEFDGKLEKSGTVAGTSQPRIYFLKYVADGKIPFVNSEDIISEAKFKPADMSLLSNQDENYTFRAARQDSIGYSGVKYKSRKTFIGDAKLVNDRDYETCGIPLELNEKLKSNSIIVKRTGAHKEYGEIYSKDAGKIGDLSGSFNFVEYYYCGPKAKTSENDNADCSDEVDNDNDWNKENDDLNGNGKANAGDLNVDCGDVGCWDTKVCSEYKKLEKNKIWDKCNDGIDNDLMKTVIPFLIAIDERGKIIFEEGKPKYQITDIDTGNKEKYTLEKAKQIYFKLKELSKKDCEDPACKNSAFCSETSFYNKLASDEKKNDLWNIYEILAKKGVEGKSDALKPENIEGNQDYKTLAELKDCEDIIGAGKSSYFPCMIRGDYSRVVREDASMREFEGPDETANKKAFESELAKKDYKKFDAGICVDRLKENGNENPSIEDIRKWKTDNPGKAVGFCAENSQPKIESYLKEQFILSEGKHNVYFEKKDREAILKIGDKEVLKISEKETPFDKLEVKFQLSKLTRSKGSTPQTYFLNSFDNKFELNEKLPFRALVSLNIKDDGSVPETKTKIAEKENSLLKEVAFCMPELKLEGGYDVKVGALGDRVTFFKPDETIFEQLMKNIVVDLRFGGGKLISGTIKIKIINEIQHGLQYTRDVLESGRSETIRKLVTVRMADSIGKLVDSSGNEVMPQRWGCEDFKKGSYNLEKRFLGIGKTFYLQDVCLKYKNEKLEHNIEYSFDTETFKFSGGVQGDISSVEKKVSIENFVKFMEILRDSAESIEQRINDEGKTFLKIIARLPQDNTVNPKIMEADKLVTEVQNAINICNIKSKADDRASLNTEQDYIGTEGYVSYYFVRDSELISPEGDSVRLSSSIPLEKPVVKIFYYNESSFQNESNIKLYRYEDSEIEDNCKVESVNSNSFNVTMRGGNFSAENVRIEIPENAFNSSAVLKVENVFVTNCMGGVQREYGAITNKSYNSIIILTIAGLIAILVIVWLFIYLSRKKNN